MKFLSFRGLCCHAPRTVGGYEAGGTSGEVEWALGQSGVLSLQGWS